MALIIATRPILYGGRMYDPGAQLPATDTRMVEAWLTHGSAREIAPEPLTAKTDAPAHKAEPDISLTAENEKTNDKTHETAPTAPPIPAPAVKGRAKRQG